MVSSARKCQYEKYLSALNKHRLEEILEFYDKDCRIVFDYDTVAVGIDEIQSMFVDTISDAEYSYELVEYLPVHGDDQIRVHLKRTDNSHLAVTYLFSKASPQKYTLVFATFLNI
ncbi:unnamed protein product [Adineta ricciae]|uniref:SnoaL-like domain-containing protein n=1 Tax=Adineta ricciae TaxID=249248 RepID=A0A813R438_ADIRI|nr:unnamed protein product [Adineta ricciae]